MDFLKKCYLIHNDKYDYSLVDYINNKTKVRIICFEHGEFWQTPSKHISGQGCPKCANDKLRHTNETFIGRSNIIHNDKYDYSLVDYINNKTKVRIICFEHGEFWQIPANHLNGSGCPKCNNNYKLTTDLFIERSNIIHDNKYDYSLVNYKNNKTKVIIICNKHGEFKQRPDAHLNGQGCSKCH